MPTCKKCGVELEGGKNWWRSCEKHNECICIECAKTRQHQWRKENPNYKQPLIICKGCGKEKPHEAHGLCRQCYHLIWYKTNRNHILDRIQQYRQEHKKEIAVYNCKYRQNHKEKLSTARRQRHQEHRLKENEQSHRWKAENRQRLAVYNYQYRQENPEVVRRHNHLRRARLVSVAITPVNEQGILELYNYTCIYCGDNRDLTLDHVVPLNDGGAHSEDNLVVACRKCNCSKHTKPLTEWLQTQPYSRVWLF